MLTVISDLNAAQLGHWRKTCKSPCPGQLSYHAWNHLPAQGEESSYLLISSIWLVFRLFGGIIWGCSLALFLFISILFCTMYIYNYGIKCLWCLLLKLCKTVQIHWVLGCNAMGNSWPIGLVFAPIQGLQIQAASFWTWEEIKRKARLFLFFSDPDNIYKLIDSPTPDALLHNKSFKNKSSFNPAAPYELESIFAQIDMNFQTFKLQKKTFTQLESQAWTISREIRKSSLLTKAVPWSSCTNSITLDKTLITYSFLWRTINIPNWWGHT